jgi:hypothetical protein
MTVDNGHGGSPHAAQPATNVRREGNFLTPAISLGKIELHPLQRVFLRGMQLW